MNDALGIGQPSALRAARQANGAASSAPPASPYTPPQVAVPKGGGAIRGIDEKFAANPATGTGSLTIELPVAAARAGFGPNLSLEYDSGSGNGVFGVGWRLSLSSITRRTDKGVPRYDDDHESDTFVLSGWEDLVPLLREDDAGNASFDDHEAKGYRIRLYRPRIEGLFARIERWLHLDTGETHWRTFSRDNVLTLYGIDSGSRVTDPDVPGRVFSWLISRSYDDYGNAVFYDYAAEDAAGVDLERPNEANRSRTANRYPRRIRYGNRVPLLREVEVEVDAPACAGAEGAAGAAPSGAGEIDPETVKWMFEVLFDYGEGRYRDHSSDDGGDISSEADVHARTAWPERPDPFSTYRSGFEIRTYRLCHRVLMFHHFEQLGSDPCLVRSMSLHYDGKAIGSFLTSVIQAGHRRRDDGRYLTRRLPALEFAYSASPLEDPDFDGVRLEDVDTASLANLPEGVDGSRYRWLDLDGEGISGVLTEQGGGWCYKPNLGAGRLGAMEAVRTQPSLAALSSGREEFIDVAGDGNLDLVDLSCAAAGFYERTLDGEWGGFRAYRMLPVQDWTDPNLRFVDLTGDGIADILITEDDAFRWHPSLMWEGYGAGWRVPVPLHEEDGPRILFADGSDSIYLADMSGDGLPDLVRIRNGEICYWPNRGYGHFGAKITMDRSPWFDEPDLFDQSRIRLADTDGSGTTDIVYLGSDRVMVFLNESGNGWSSPRIVSRFPATDDLASVTVADFLGCGTACLLWSSPLPGDAGRQLRYVDLMRGQKPHLLIRTVNNLGAETRIEYASSTEFYLADKAAGAPWITRLPFPVQVVARLETFDYVGRNRFVSCYTYHHGFYDGVEREFRGFGRVDQLDTEEFAVLAKPGVFPAAENTDRSSNVPPVLTKTWFHTGVYLAGGRVSRDLAHEYYREGMPDQGEAELSDDSTRAMQLADTVLPQEVTPEEARQACRSLKGSMLRQEIYGLDGTAAACRPYSVTESNRTIRMLQPQWSNRHAVFLTHSREDVTFHYERKLYEVDGARRADPRVTHDLTLEVDDYGNVLTAVSVGYGRRVPNPSPLLSDWGRRRQAQILVTLTEKNYTNAVHDSHVYRTPLIADARTYELLQVRPASQARDVTNLFRFAEMREKVLVASDGHHDVSCEEVHPTGLPLGEPSRRLVARTCTLYRPDDLGALAGASASLLPLGTLESRAVPGDAYRMAFTPILLSNVYRREDELLLPRPSAVLGSVDSDGGGYVDLDGDGNWWAPSGRTYFDARPDASPAQELAEARRHFFTRRRFTDPFGNTTTVEYDPNDLLVTRSTDAVGNTSTAVNDYRVLHPTLLTDPNGNRAAARYDALGLVAGTAVMGKATEEVGDSLDGFAADLAPREIDDFFRADDPQTIAPGLLRNASTRIVYDVHRFARSRASQPDDPTLWEPAYTATLARETHASDPLPPGGLKIQIGFSYSDGFGREIQKKEKCEPGPVARGGPIVDPRWVGTGWTIFNNKANPVRQYESFFSQSIDRGHRFEFAVKVGVSPILFYDSMQRSVATLHPDHTFEKVVFDPWRQSNWDVSDTVLVPDPATDPDVGQFFAPLAPSEYLPTWYEQRISGDLGPADQAAAQNAARHADTSSQSYSDSLGRTILTIADEGGARKFPTRITLDIVGNPLAVTDALDRVVTRSVYDMLGSPILQSSMEAGFRWTLADATGKPVRVWNGRDYTFRMHYDALRRQHRSFVEGGGRGDPAGEFFANPVLYEHTIYGDSPEAGLTPDQGADANVRTRVLRRHDAAGIVTTDLYDFTGNLRRSTRRFAREYKSAPDWQDQPALESEALSTTTTYDALNRVVTVTAPDGSIYRPCYNDASLLAGVDMNLRGAELAGEPVWTPFVTGIEYNARRQRTLISYANGARTSYEYDPETFRLIRLKTTRPPRKDRRLGTIFRSPKVVQDLHYTYDPVGNITSIADGAVRTIFHANRRVEPTRAYTYDALYRLLKATGRESIAQTAFRQDPGRDSRRDYPYVGAAALGDLEALRSFSESYDYDAVGNLTRVRHRSGGAAGSWTREYTYDEPSLLEPSRVSNRLSYTSLTTDGGSWREPYSYDENGNVTRMPHLTVMRWDFKDHLHATSPQVTHGSHAGTTYYVYDANGERARTVRRRSADGPGHERIYVGGFEVYRRFAGAGAVVAEWQTLHVMDDKQRLALVETRTVKNRTSTVAPQPQLRYQVADNLGSAVLELGDAGDVVTYEEYGPYGGSTLQAGRSAAEIGLKRYRYNGKERDRESGFYDFGARCYAPWLGRWISCDPLGIADGANLYRFARDNPISRRDSRGRQTSGPPNWDDYFTFIRNEAQFQAGADNPPTIDVNIARANAGPVGTAVHTAATGVVNDLRRAGFVGAEQIYSEVAVDRVSGLVNQIGGHPIRGNYNLDLVAMPQGSPPLVALQSTLVAGQADVVADIKTGGGTIQAAHATFGQRGVTVNASFNNAPSTGTAPALPAPQTPASPAPAAPPSPAATANAVNAVDSAAAANPIPAAGEGGAAPTSASGPVTTAVATSGASAFTNAGNLALSATRTVVPGVAEAEIGLATGAMYAHAAGYATVGTALETGAAYVPVVGGSLVAGAAVGNLAATGAAKLGASQEVAEGTGALAAAGTGAAVGALIGSAFGGVGAAPGAVIGAAAGAAGYYLSRYF